MSSLHISLGPARAKLIKLHFIGYEIIEAEPLFNGPETTHPSLVSQSIGFASPNLIFYNCAPNKSLKPSLPIIKLTEFGVRKLGSAKHILLGILRYDKSTEKQGTLSVIDGKIKHYQ